MLKLQRCAVLMLMVLSLGCAAGALIPFVSPLLEQVAEYVIGETPEIEFVEDVIQSVIGNDPVKILWRGVEEAQSKYVIGTVTTRAVRDTTEADTLDTDAHFVPASHIMTETITKPMASLTFMNGILFAVNTEDPDTTLDVIEPPVPPGPDPDECLECLSGCLDGPPGQVRKCRESCEDCDS